MAESGLKKQQDIRKSAAIEAEKAIAEANKQRNNLFGSKKEEALIFFYIQQPVL